MLQEEYCRVLCQVDLKQKDVTDFKQVSEYLNLSILHCLCKCPFSTVQCSISHLHSFFLPSHYTLYYSYTLNYTLLQAIQRQYHHNWIIDNLPAASILDTDQYVSTQYVGYPIGKPPPYTLYLLSI